VCLLLLCRCICLLSSSALIFSASFFSISLTVSQIISSLYLSFSRFLRIFRPAAKVASARLLTFVSNSSISISFKWQQKNRESAEELLLVVVVVAAVVVVVATTYSPFTNRCCCCYYYYYFYHYSIIYFICFHLFPLFNNEFITTHTHH
jgi:hypothetical protein